MPQIYRFYRISDLNDEVNKRYNNYPVYAFTDSKELANDFMKTRNMKKFKLVKSKLSKEEYTEYYNQNRTSALDVYKYLTILGDNGDDWKEIKMTTTWMEREVVSDKSRDSVMNELDGSANPELLKDKYITVLSKLQYMQLWAINQSYYEGDFEDSIPEILVDQLSLLLYINKDTF